MATLNVAALSLFVVELLWFNSQTKDVEATIL